MRNLTNKFVKSVKHVFSKSQSITKTAKILGVSENLIKNILNPTPQTSKSNEVQVELNNIVVEDNSLYLREMQTILWQKRMIWKSTSTICRQLKTIKLNRKKIQEHAIERFTDESLEKRLNYLAAIATIPVEKLYFLDETGVDLQTIKRRYGRAKVGQAATTIRKYVRTKRLNLLSCIGWKGVVGFRIIEDSTSSIDFNSFVTELLSAIPEGSTLVLDNASFHQSTALQATVELNGLDFVFLPPYSPDLNPIELSYGWLKTNLKSDLDMNWRRFDMAASMACIYSSITPELTQQWFCKCFYFQQQ